MSRVIVVVPCFNEAERLDADAFRAFVKVNSHVRFLFVDDGSTDATWTLLESLAGENPRAFETLRLNKNCGKAEAVRRGMVRAFELGPDYAAYWDADLATPLDAILSFREILDARTSVEIVLGSRVRRLGATIERGAARHYIGRIFATCASLVLGLAVYDTQCGAKMFRCDDDTHRLFEEEFLSSWIFDVELIARFVAARESVDHASVAPTLFEYPLREWHHKEGSKLRALDGLRVFVEMMRIYRTYGGPVRRR